MTTPFELDPVFQELEEELGDTIPSLVVEAQRRYTRENFYSAVERHGRGGFPRPVRPQGPG